MRHLFLSFFFVGSLTALSQPTISSFSPLSGHVGTTVTISGTNFNATAANNIVYFGATRATVTNATTTTLTVTVPAGSTTRPLTVTTGGLTAYSKLSFVVTFPASVALSTASFNSTAVNFPLSSGPRFATVGDFDLDGRPDVAAYATSAPALSVLRNTTSTPGTITFANKIDFTSGASGWGILAAGDLDGDGKLDVVTANYTNNNVSVFLNNSPAAGTISFAAKQDIATGTGTQGVAIHDLNADGKPDVIIAVYNQTNDLVILKNTSTVAGTFTYSLTNFAISGVGGGYAVSVDDFDGDGKPDVALDNEFSGIVHVLRNTSSVATISFAPKVDLTTLADPQSIQSGDINGDGKPEIILDNYNGGGTRSISVFKNISSGSGNIAFDTRLDITNGTTSSYQTYLHDMDGDTKPDIVASNYMLRNLSSGGTLSLSAPIAIGSNNFSQYPVDIDNNGKPDLVGVEFGAAQISIYKNINNDPVISSFSPTTAAVGTTVTINGSNLTGATAVSFGGTSASSFAVVNATTITAVVAAGTSGSVSVTTPGGTGTKSGFTFDNSPSITSFTPTTGGTGTVVTITGLRFTGATGVTFGGVAAASFTVNSATSITATPAAGASGNVGVTTSWGTGTKSGFTFSNAPSVTSFTPSSGGMGDVITVTGARFTGATAVTFGGVAASSFTVNSATSITATVSAGASGPVAVTTPNGSGNLAGFVYSNAPSVQSFAPTKAAVGESVVITGNRFTGATAVSFGSVSAQSFTVNSDTQITAIVGNGSSGVVQVTTPQGSGSKAGFTLNVTPDITSFTPASAGQGGVVTITGVRLNYVSIVKFGGVTASSFSFISPTELKAYVAGGASGDVYVSNFSGTESDTHPGFTFIPAPTIASFSPTSVAIGGTVVITGTDFSGATVVKIGSTSMTSFTVDSPTQITLTVSDSPPTGAITVTTPAGSGTKAGFTLAPGPTITSFAPASGPVGTVVTINGTNFDPVAANNVVFFGAVSAPATEASGTTLKVVVPPGSSYAPLMIRTGKLVAHAVRPFNVTFAGGGVPFAANTFSDPIRFPFVAGGRPAVGDLNSDGKPDVVVARNGGVLAIVNSTSNRDINFESPISVAISGQQNQAVVADFDSDGKQDIAVVGLSTWAIRNTSTGSTLTLGTPQDLGAGSGSSVVAGDLDGDGRIDLAVGTGSDVRILRNISLPGAILFSTPATVIAGTGFATSLSIGDIDQDGRHDLVVNDITNGKIRILKNISSLSNPSFTIVSLTSGTSPTRSYIADLDSNLRPDITTFYSVSLTASVFFNGGDPGTIAFSPTPTNNITLDVAATGSEVVDLDGDTKPDLISFNFSSKLCLYRNVTAPDGNFSFQGFTKIGPSTYSDILVADFDGNGKPDLFGSTSQDIFVMRNQIDEPVISSFTPKKGGTGSVITISGENLGNVTSVTFGGVPASSFTSVSATSLTAVVGAGTSGTLAVTTAKGMATAKGFVFSNGLFITSVTPVSGSVGATITISGSKFSSVPTENIVRFGTTRALVTSASESELVVKVPAGASYGPITVTKDNMVASSPRSFTPTFGGSSLLPTGAFVKTDLAGEVSSRSISCGDYDDDGKTDLVITNAGSDAISVFRNTSTPGSALFASKVTFPTGATPEGIVTGDLDGDGKLDLVVANSSSNSVSVLRNTSSIGVLSFASKVDFTTFTNPQVVILADLDNDGKLDIATANYHGSGNNSILRNTSTPGNISFAARIDIVSDAFPSTIAALDLNSDGLPELVVANSNNSTISTFGNRSVPGTLSFASKEDLNVGAGPLALAAGDFYGADEFADLVLVNSSSVKVLAGNGAGALSASSTNNITGSLQPGVLADLNGDATPDFILPTGSNRIAWLKGPSMQIRAELLVSDGAKGVAAADFDGDGITDFATVNENSGTVSIMHNKTSAINSFSPQSGSTGTTITISGIALGTATGVKFGGTPAASFAIVSPTTITAVVGNGSTGNVAVTTPGGEVQLAGFTYTQQASTITSFAPATATTGETVTITGTNLSGAKSVAFGGVAAQSFTVVNATTITAVVGTGATGSITVVNSLDQVIEKSGFTYTTVTGLDPEFTDRYQLDSYPNPTNGQDLRFRLHESWKGYLAIVELADLTGRSVHKALWFCQTENTISFTNPLSSGFYTISIVLDGKRVTRKFVVAN